MRDYACVGRMFGSASGPTRRPPEASVTRFILATVAAVFAAVASFAPAALACVSCNYTPEVAKSANSAAPKKKAPTRAATKKKSPSKQYVKRTPPQKATQKAARTRPVEPRETVTEAAPDKEDVAETASGTSSGSSGGYIKPSTATTTFARRDAGIDDPEASEPEEKVGCRKFSATIGATVTVPCE